MDSLNFVEQKSINYSERSGLDYKVYLKENDFYEEEYLGKNMSYIASLIDNVNVSFNYNFISDENLDLNFNYKIVGKLVIADTDGKKSYFEKDYLLMDTKNLSMTDSKNQSIAENIVIDYDYYNSLANDFKTKYGVDTSSNLIVYLTIDKSNADTEKTVIINNASLMSITIPLSEKAIDIKMNYNEINDTNSLISKSNVIIDDIIYMVIAVILLIISIVMFVKVVRYLMLLRSNSNSYDKYISKLLTEYDRLIVETSTGPITNGDNIIKINKFQELLDVRDNLKLPIMYYSITKHQKCCFYITYENKIYLHTVKAIDFEVSK